MTQSYVLPSALLSWWRIRSFKSNDDVLFVASSQIYQQTDLKMHSNPFHDQSFETLIPAVTSVIRLFFL